MSQPMTAETALEILQQRIDWLKKRATDRSTAYRTRIFDMAETEALTLAIAALKKQTQTEEVSNR